MLGTSPNRQNGLSLADEGEMIRGAHVQIDHVTHRYKRGRGLALKDVAFEVQPGSITALVGRSGSGKSTLLHILAGLTRASEGRIYIDGKRVEGPNPAWVVMFQQPSLLPWMSVSQNVGLGLTFLGRREGRQARIADLLELVELGAFADRNVQDLSGGQQQRVALARSLAVEPDLLMLDEPFSALDTFTRTALQRDVRAIVRRLGLTLILVTHDIAEAVLMADRAVIMADGQVAADLDLGLPDERSGLDPRLAEARARIQSVFEAAAGRRIAAEPGPETVLPLTAKRAPPDAGAPIARAS
jgi:NitT/TauT family transport system ATP-binding protein